MGIFARVLQEILVRHLDQDISHLGGAAARTDPIWYPLRRLAIAPEVISRLKDAATSDNKRATLNPDDLEYAADQLHFTPEERARLRAALLAQGVEIFLRDRMTAEETGASSQIAQAVYAQLLAQFQPLYDKVRAPDVEDLAPLEEALSLADRAGAFVQAAETARTLHRAGQAAFWKRLAVTAYEEIATRVRPIEPALADEFTKVVEKLRTS